MSLGYKDRTELIQTVVSDVSNFEFGCSWNIGIPPCFDANESLDEIAERLRQLDISIVADVTPDALPNAEAYLRELHRAWSVRTPLAPLKTGPADAMFDYLIASLPNDVLFVQVVRQFHKILDVLDVWFLGKLRDAEQRRRIRTITATPLTIPDLKKRWDRKHPCTVSGYGTGHADRYIEPLSNAEVVAHGLRSGLSNGVAKYVAAVSGGYPECFQQILGVIRRSNQPSLPDSVIISIKQSTVSCLARFIDLMDDTNQTTYRDAVIDLHNGVEEDNAREILQRHPWARIILKEENELRSELLADAAVADMLRDSVSSGDQSLNRMQRGIQLYRNRKFADAANIFSSVPATKRDFEVTRCNAAVMKCLYSNDCPGEDTDWSAVVQSAETAGSAIKSCTGLDRVAPFILERLDRIRAIGGSVVAAQKGNDRRVVDVLAGLRSGALRSDEAAAFLLVCKFESSCAISGHAAACQASLYLPEQLLRVWAFWALGVNYYSSPADSDDTWDIAAAAWPKNHGDLTRSAPGIPFSSLPAFGHFIIAEAIRSGIEKSSLPVEDFSALNSVFSRYEQLRNPNAHSYCFTTRKERNNFFSIAERWLECTLQACPVRMQRRELLELLEPLPLVNRDGCMIDT